MVDQAIGKDAGIGQVHGALDVRAVFTTQAAKGAVPGIATETYQLTHGKPLGLWQLLRQVGHLTGEVALAPVCQRLAVEQYMAAAGCLLAGE